MLLSVKWGHAYEYYIIPKNTSNDIIIILCNNLKYLCTALKVIDPICVTTLE